MREFAIEIITGYIVLTTITFVPILAARYIYKKFNGKENKHIEDISACIVVFGLVFGIYWILMNLNLLFYLSGRTISIDKIKTIFAQ